MMIERGDELDLQIVDRNPVRSIYEIPGYSEYQLLIFSDITLMSGLEFASSELLGQNRLKISQLWRSMLEKWGIASHFVTLDVREYPESLQKYVKQLSGRSMLIHRVEPIPVRFEMLLRLHGPLWEKYQRADVKRTESPGLSFKSGNDLPFPMEVGFSENAILTKPVMYCWKTGMGDPPTVLIEHVDACQIIEGFDAGYDKAITERIEQITSEVSKVLGDNITITNLGLDFGVRGDEIVFAGDYFVPGRAGYLLHERVGYWSKASTMQHQEIVDSLTKELPIN